MSIFGQNPADIVNALRKSENLNDVADKALARQNLDVPSKDEVLYSGVPIGMILPYWGDVAPAGYLPCFGQVINSTSFPDLVEFLNPGNATATLPDLRGEFIRGWDNGRGVDTGRAVKSTQADMLQGFSPVASLAYSTAGTLGFGTAAATPYFNNGGGTTPTPTLDWDATAAAIDSLTLTKSYVVADGVNGDVRMGPETRARNVAVLYCIKAFDAVQNHTSSLNLPGLVSDYSTLNAAAVKYADFLGGNQALSGNGYQKLPGGLIIQWGTSVVGATTGTITFPITFPNSVFTVSGSPSGVATSTGAGGPAIFINGNSSATVYVWGTGNWSIRWQAFGY